MLDFLGRLTANSMLPYAAWRMRGRKGSVKLALRSGARFELREDAPFRLGNTDYGIAYEVFVLEAYKDHTRVAPQPVRCVVDLGANVGFSVLYFLHAYPKARVIAFEPHPGHFAQAARNLTLDGSRDRVDLYQKATGPAARSVWLSDLGSSSSVAAEQSPGLIAVEMIDVFAYLGSRQIDLLKMDIEGGEYELLGDDRFGNLAIAALVLEWHTRGGGVADREWCLARLRSFGYSAEERGGGRNAGILWAKR